jgi:hypothetical protein
MSMMKMGLRRLSNSLGLEVRRTARARPVNLSERRVGDPVAAVYEAAGRPVLLRVPLARCIHFDVLAFPCDAASASPFVATAVAYSRGVCSSYRGSPLERYYELCQPKRAVDLMGLEGFVSGELTDLPASAAPLFWRPERPQRKVVRRQQELAADNRAHGRMFAASDGDIFFGPVSERKGNLEFDRIRATLDRISRRGFRVDRDGVGNIEAICLDSGGDWRCFVVAAGQHRIAALAALGYDEIVVQVRREGLGGVIRREDAPRWPLVRDGTLSENQARAMFDRMFRAEQPPAAHAWLRWLQKRPDVAGA